MKQRKRDNHYHVSRIAPEGHTFGRGSTRRRADRLAASYREGTPTNGTIVRIDVMRS